MFSSIADRLAENILIRRDAIFWRRNWTRRPFFWLLVAIAIIQTAVMANLSVILGREVDEIGDILYYFSSIHLLIHVVAPLGALRLAMSPKIQSQIEEFRATPIPECHIFWWLWARAFTPVIGVVFVLYFPMWLAAPWLYWWMIGFKPIAGSNWPVAIVAELTANTLAVLLVSLPWIRGSWPRLWILILGLGFLVLAPAIPPFLPGGHWPVTCFASTTMDTFPTVPPTFHLVGPTVGGPGMSVDVVALSETPSAWIITPYATYARWHPLITMAYFLVSVGWSAALGVGVGLRRQSPVLKSYAIVLAAGPMAEGLVSLIPGAASFFSNPTSLLEWLTPPFHLPLYSLLLFYTFSYGLFWMGLKWNLAIWLSRRPLPRD